LPSKPEKDRRQRLRLTFTKGDEVKYISHLDLMRVWERALRRANMPLLYSKGYNPRPKISIAAPLAVGITGEREIMDVVLERTIAPMDFATSASRQLPRGISLVEVEEVYASLPSLQSQVRSAEYLITLEAGEPREEIERRVAALLRSESLPRQRRGKTYDLRPLIESASLEAGTSEHHLLRIRLRTGEQGTGRPDEVVAALGVQDLLTEVTRTQLHFASLVEE
jgi:radical SAM-linked protein